MDCLSHSVLIWTSNKEILRLLHECGFMQAKTLAEFLIVFFSVYIINSKDRSYRPCREISLFYNAMLAESKKDTPIVPFHAQCATIIEGLISKFFNARKHGMAIYVCAVILARGEQWIPDHLPFFLTWSGLRENIILYDENIRLIKLMGRPWPLDIFPTDEEMMCTVVRRAQRYRSLYMPSLDEQKSTVDRLRLSSGSSSDDIFDPYPYSGPSSSKSSTSYGCRSHRRRKSAHRRMVI